MLQQDVIIVGAGFAGLAAALEMQRLGHSFRVLEARRRVGGKVQSTMNSLGERLDMGGQFFCEDMPSVMELTARFAKARVSTPVAGALTVQPQTSSEEAHRVRLGGMAIRERMEALDPRDPEIAGLTVADWLARQPDPAAMKEMFHSMVEGLWCLPIGEVPLWYLADNDRRVTSQTYELQYFLAETMHSLAEDMAEALGDHLLLEAPATAVRHHADGVTVSTPKGDVDARRLIIALPPTMAARVAFSPPLPEAVVRALSAWKSGSVVKTMIRYSNPFWRDSGLSGMVMWRDIHGLFACDTSKDDAHAALVVWTAGPLARSWRLDGDVVFRRKLIGRLSAALGVEAETQMLTMQVRDWTGDQWSGGGYSDIITDLDAYAAEDILRGGFGPVSFASSEIALSFPGYIEGAIVAGRKAALATASALEA